MSGVLSYALGLEAGGFNAAIAGASQGLGGFITTAARTAGVTALVAGAMRGLEGSLNLVGGVMEAISRGSELQVLSKRTEESVGSLFLLQAGFRAVDLDATKVGDTVFRLQKSLGGMNEMGEDTKSVFHALGLSIGSLKTMNAAGQMETIGNALAALDNEGAANAASKIFGKGSAQDMLQLARSTKEFSQALRDNAAGAVQAQRTAAAFEVSESTMGKVKAKSNALFAGIAEGAAPGIQMVLDMLNKVDLSGIGSQLGTILGGFTEAFKEGDLSSAIGEALSTGFEMAVAVAPGIFAKLGEVLLRTFEKPILFLSAGMEWAMNNFMEKFSSSPAMKALGVLLGGTAGAYLLKDSTAGYKAPSVGETMDKQAKEGLKFNIGAGEFGLGDIKAAADEALKNGQKEAGAAFTRFFEAMKKYADKLPKLGESESKNGTGRLALPEVKTTKLEATSLEKMGFVFGNGGPTTMLLDHARRTADGVERLVSLLTPGKGGKGASFANVD